MQFLHPPHQNRALTLVEVLIVIVVLAVLVILLLPALSRARNKAEFITCNGRLKGVGLAAQIWAGDNFNEFPQSRSITNGGAMEMLARGNIAAYFQIMSNELSTPGMLICPADIKSVEAHNFKSLTNNNISYFVNLNANKSYPQTVAFGDDNFVEDGVPVKSGGLYIWTNRSIAWTDKRHQSKGNVALADGSVEMLNNNGLTNAFTTSGVLTPQIVIP